MPTARYFIVHDQVQDEWHIKYGNEEYGPYKTQDEAMVFAMPRKSLAPMAKTPRFV